MDSTQEACHKDMISIIIPAYNAEKFLAETLESILQQSYDNFEVVIINDGSTDGTQYIIDHYKTLHPGIFRTYTQDNCGQSATRNKAMNYVQGEYIAFIDADDIVEKDYLKRLYMACKKENADIAIGGYIKFWSDTGEIVYSRNAADWDVYFKDGLHHVFQYSPCGKLYSASFLKDHHFQFSVGEQLEDGPYGVMTHIVARKVAVLDGYGYRYRMYAASTMGGVRTTRSKPKVPYKGIEEAILKVREFRKDKDTDEVLEYCIIKVLAGLCTNMLKSCDNETRKEVCRYCYKTLKEYFPDATHNPYIGIRKLKKLPLSHRCAVKLFMIAYRIKMLYPFSLIVSRMI